MERVENLIWDFNGTLLDDLGLSIDSMNGLLARRALPLLDPKRYRQLFGFPVRDYYEAIGLDLDREPFAELAIEYLDAYDPKAAACPLHAEALPTLLTARDAGLRQFVLSAAEHSWLERVLDELGIRPLFEGVAGIDDQHAAGKVEQGRELMARHRLDPERTLVIGDTIHDLEVAEALGLHCVLVAQGHQSRSRLEAVHDRVTGHLGELPGLLPSLRAPSGS